jgi:ribosomal protein S18 acetylase RimI-like enzyme
MIHLRTATPDDSEFLYQLKKQTVKRYIKEIWGWNEEFQRSFHQKNFDSQKYSIIQKDGKDIGCLSVEEQSDKLFLNIIEIKPNYQNKGIGSLLIRDLIRRGSQEKKFIELQVLKVNQRAFKLYKTLGFTLRGETETHYLMEHHVE